MQVHPHCEANKVTERTEIDQNKIADRPVFLNVLEAAAFLGVQRGWLDKRRLKKSRQNPAFIKMGGQVLYRKEDLLEYLEESRQYVEAG